MFNIILTISSLFLINLDTLAEDNRIIIASTTSTHDTGLLDFINNEFEKKFNISTHVLSLGTGQAMTVAKNGDATKRALLVEYSLVAKNQAASGICADLTVS